MLFDVSMMTGCSGMTSNAGSSIVGISALRGFACPPDASLGACLCIYLPACLSVCLSACLSVCATSCLLVCLCV